MVGAPWNGLFYAATLEFLLTVAGATVAASTDDMIWRPVGFLVMVVGFVLLVRTIRKVLEPER
ncbi:MAG TPA: hypothetical protein VIG76_11705 [Amnibacterium sp.]|jgi:hypothetical protein|uniref:hypothetical protein n=1 Tax=Amnibacterium sp. TaxID=1872496 RepID=UPI002F95E495